MAKQIKNSVKELEIPIYFYNYKLLQDKEFVLKGSNIYFIQGPNNVGKTSFLKALQSLMIASDDTPDKVTRGSGETEGHYEATIPAADGTLITIHHEFTDDGKGKFYAVDPDGNKISQVTEIRRLFNYTPINVSEFFAMSNSADGRRKQRDIILKLLPDSDRQSFNELDLQEQHHYEQRTNFNKLVDQAESNIKAIIIPKEDEALIPREEEVKSLITLYTAVQTARTLIPEKDKAIKDAEARKIKLENEIKVKQEELIGHEQDIVAAKEAMETVKKITVKYEKISDEELATKLATGNNIISKITSLSTKTSLKKEWTEKLDENKKKSDELTVKINNCRDGKADIVSGSDLPVENISFDDGYLTIDGFQFKESQICESDAVLILANILAKINQGPIQIIGDASILDKEKLEMLNKIAEDNNKVMFVDEVIRTSTEMVVVGYEDLKKEDLEQNFEKLDGKKKKESKKSGDKVPVEKQKKFEKDLTEPSGKDIKEPLAGNEESEEPVTLF